LKLGSPSHARLLFEAVRQRGLASRAWFTGGWKALDAIGAVDPATRRYYGDVSKPHRLQRFLAEQPARARPGISMERRLVTPDSVAQLHRTGVEVLAYTVSEASEALDLLRAGVDGLITNNLSLTELYASKA
jgi:glycerophosphoryl diester phosphodiesterase